MLLLSIYVLYSNVTYLYPVSCLVEIKLFQLFQCVALGQLPHTLQCVALRQLLHIIVSLFSWAETVSQAVQEITLELDTSSQRLARN